MGRIVAGVIIILLGIAALTGLSLFKFIFAIILIIIGVRILAGHRPYYHWDWHKENRNSSTEDMLNEVAIFSPVGKVVKSEHFGGGKIAMIFSGGDIDISGVKAAKAEVAIDFVAVFGGGRLVIPKGWTVRASNAAFVGSVRNESAGGGGETTLHLKGVAVFGEIVITN